MLQKSKKSIEKIINKHFNSLENKINKLNKNAPFIVYTEPLKETEDLSESKTNRLIDKNMNAILSNIEIQVNSILQTYDKLSRNELSLEEIYQFAQYLVNIYNKANITVKIIGSFGINYDKIEKSIKLMKINDTHDKVIGIDNFISLSHTNSALLIDLVAINNNFYLTNYDDITEEEQHSADKFIIWRNKLNESVIHKLNKIRNRRELPLFKYTKR